MDRPLPDPIPPEGERRTWPVPGGGATRVVCTLATGRHRRLLTESVPTMLAWAGRHGWDVVVSCERLDKRPPSWTKLVLIRELMQAYDVVFWVDADALIVDLERDVMAEVDADKDIWFARHPQERNPEATVLNAGIILARSTPFTERLFDAVWAKTEYIDHNWWENAALLDVLGYSLEAPYPQLRTTEWQRGIGEMDLAWNSVPGYCESPCPAIDHHARGDHDDFDRRLMAMAADRRSVIERWPDAFGFPAHAGSRDHAFEGLDKLVEPTVEEVLVALDHVDDVAEVQRLKIYELNDLLEDTVTQLVSAERDRDAARTERDALHAELVSLRDQAGELDRRLIASEQELQAMRNTKLFRAAGPLRALYARVRR